MAKLINYKTHTPKALNSITIDFKDLTERILGTRMFYCSELNYKPLTIDHKTGYVTKDIETGFDKDLKEILIINAGVGQGKTTAIYNIISKLAKDPKNLIIMASPFKILVNKDFDELSKRIRPNYIQNYEQIQNAPWTISKADIIKKFIARKRVHITTINSLLGNPGEIAFFQSNRMKCYIEEVHKHAEKAKKRIFLFIDEIHESPNNFSTEYVSSLLNRINIYHKIIISSATYTESSIEVLKLLSSLRVDHPRIMTSIRVKSVHQSDLKLVFLDKNISSERIQPLRIIEQLINERKISNFHIFSYSRKIAEQLANKKWFGSKAVNLCTSIDKNPFDPSKINIGTTFKSGVNLPPGDSFFIIMPPVSKNYNYKNNLGVFSEGVPAIVQSLARARSNNTIYVILPRIGDHIVSKSNGYMHELKKFMPSMIIENAENYIPLNKEENSVTSYISRASQDSEYLKNKLNSTAKLILSNMASRIKHNDYLQEELNLDELLSEVFNLFPSLYERKIIKAQQYLVSKHLSSGKYATPYLIWAAYHNQFTNCTLNEIIVQEKISVKVDIRKVSCAADLKHFIDKEYCKTCTELYDLDISSIYSEIRYAFTKFVKEGTEINSKVALDGVAVSKPNNKKFLVLLQALFSLSIKEVKFDNKILNDGDEMERFYYAQRLLHSSKTGNDLEKSWYELKLFIDDFVKQNKGKQTLKGNPEINIVFNEKKLKSIIDKIQEFDPILKPNSPVSFFNKEKSNFYVQFLNKFVELVSAPKKRYEILGTLYQKHVKTSDFPS